MKNCFLFIFICSSLVSRANIQLPAVISSNMVLQQNSTVKLWGWANPLEKVFITTSWNNKTDSLITPPSAGWQLTVQTLAAGGPYTITFQGYNTVTVQNILIGEVWVCSGQSNMEMNEGWGLPDVAAEFPTCKNNNIRFFTVDKISSAYPQDDCKGQWVNCDSNTLKSFSAAAYFFGKKLNKELNVPIGLINSSWGSTSAEQWTPANVINNDPVLKNACDKIAVNPWSPVEPGVAYNAMILPIINYNIAGVIWYQGESNTRTASTYSKLMDAMIDSWRKDWNKEFPFYYVQIAPCHYGNKNIAALLREAQTQSMDHPNAGMVVITDLVTDTNDIHPKDKHDVGYRLANMALAKTYKKENIVYQSPVYKNMEVEDGKAMIHFSYVDSGLITKYGQVTELYIAGDDKIFYPAGAQIKNNILIVWSEKVKQPAAVRYAFSNTATGNLFDTDGLPVAPFRTDNWEVDTSKVQ